MLLRDSLTYNHPTLPSPAIVRIVPALSIAALKSRIGKELSMWYCLRAINHWGSGCLDLEYAVKALTDTFGYSRSTAYRILNAGDGIFWNERPVKDFNRLQIQIYSLEKVAKHFDIRCDLYFLEIPVEEFIGHGSNRVMRQRAWLYASFHKPQGTKALPVSRASITEATGVNRRSQQRYDKVAVERTNNVADIQDVQGKMVPILELVDGKSRQWSIHKRLGNTYHCRGYRGRIGMIRRVNKTIGQSFMRGEACYLRRFFTTAKSYIRCLQRYDDPYIMVVPADRLSNGRTEWCRINP